MMRTRFLFMNLFFLLVSAAATGQSRTDTLTVYFDFDRYELRSDAKASLDRFLETTQKPSAVILKGHCDARGSDAYNQQLSERRVEAVRNYLVQQGLGAEISTAARGEKEPLNDNATEDERSLNRRVELIWQTTPTPIQEPSPPPVADTVPEEPQPSLTEKIDSVKEGETLRLRNINFYGGRHTFLPQSLPALEELLQVMKTHPKLEIQIEGHICCLAGGEDGMDFDSNDRRLSLNRARAVYYYLVQNGIDKKRMSYKGFAGTRLLVFPEVTEADRTLNRRVEIRIMKK